MNRRHLTLLVGSLVVVGGAVLATAQTDLEQRVRELIGLGRYDLARDMIDDRERRGEELSVATQWMRAQLETDPDRFDRMALDLVTDDPAGPLAFQVTLGRAREQFARGRYQTAAELLQPWVDMDPRTAPAEALLWLGMAEQAAGQPGAAVRALRAIGEDSAEYGMARALLADLALRGGRLDEANEEARRAMRADEAVGSLALSVLERAARTAGDVEAADGFAARLREEFPESAEASWLSQPPVTEAEDLPPIGTEHDFEEGRDAFALQFGAFRDRSLALRLADRVDRATDEVRIEIERDDDTVLYRVVGGRYLTRAQAEAAQSRLQGDGWTTMVLAPSRGGP